MDTMGKTHLHHLLVRRHRLLHRHRHPHLSLHHHRHQRKGVAATSVARARIAGRAAAVVQSSSAVRVTKCAWVEILVETMVTIARPAPQPILLLHRHQALQGKAAVVTNAQPVETARTNSFVVLATKCAWTGRLHLHKAPTATYAKAILLHHPHHQHHQQRQHLQDQQSAASRIHRSHTVAFGTTTPPMTFSIGLVSKAAHHPVALGLILRLMGPTTCSRRHLVLEGLVTKRF